MTACRKARLAFIGAGWWATSNHMPLLAARDDVEFVGVCRLGADELRKTANHFGFTFATEDYIRLLDECELDGVIVASPHTLHYEHARAALQRGLHVMCEKPMCTRSDHARELVDMATTGQLHLLVPYGWHYKPFVQRAKELLTQGGVGNIEYILCHMASPIRGLLSGHRLHLDDVSGQSEASIFAPDPKTWADPDIAGGGYGIAQISHSSGLMFWLSDLRAQSAFALMSAPQAKVDIYNAITVRFTSGAIATVSGAGSVPVDQDFQVDLRIFGTEGMLLLDCERARTHLKRQDGRHYVEDVAVNAGAYECSGPPNNFVDLILNKTEINWAPGEAAMRGVEMLDAAYRSAASAHEEEV